jgi:hypothetical protein
MTGNFIPGGTVWGIWKGHIYSSIVKFETKNIIVSTSDQAIPKAELYLTKDEAIDALLKEGSND